MSRFAAYEPPRHGVPDPAVVLRAAAPSDVDGILAVAASRGAVTFGPRVPSWVVDPGRVVLVAVLDGVVVGWGMVAPWAGFDDVPDGLYVSALTVAPAVRRRGIGERLLLDLIGWAAPRSAMLGSVINASNGPSLDLHLRHGFREVARSDAFAGITFTGGVGVLLVRSAA
ncbi:GNAT family N-acetyltransferase [Cellulomonas sp. PhB150]|uniref:GNAT family N-acetyltransferase n=1 Tax=Cellulomonas sp. PhB150 TaxID=2485188 RepID=UPI000F484064|nr:GNAT family N-acetyltransferase [Cellulomonas sp. PhB150]ROS26177.1 phosphinothricin acetyltransferase [Cellulomonas sp. PhB150]